MWRYSPNTFHDALSSLSNGVPVNAILIELLSASNILARKHPAGLYPRCASSIIKILCKLVAYAGKATFSLSSANLCIFTTVISCCPLLPSCAWLFLNCSMSSTLEFAVFTSKPRASNSCVDCSSKSKRSTIK